MFGNHSCNSYVINESSSVIVFGSFSFARFGFGVLTTTVTLSMIKKIDQFYQLRSNKTK